MLRTLPKIELHRHLEGSLRLQTMLEVGHEYGINLPLQHVETLRPLVQVMPDDPRSWQSFMSKFAILRQFFVSEAVIRRVTREVIIDAAMDNVKYLELRFTPKALSNVVERTPHQIVEWVCQTAEQTASEYDIMVRLIVSVNRHESVLIAEEAAQAAIDHRHMGVVALDLAGIEPGYQVYPFRDVFKRARSAGLNVTLHAGEWEGSQSIWDAMSNVGADRIGHGIRVLDDPGVVNILLERDIVLEVCPSSNVDTGVCTSLIDHPLPQLIASGLKVTINTDDPLVFGITLSDELHRTMQSMYMTLDDIKQQTLTAAQSAFLPTSERKQLVQQFSDWLYP